ncbi:MAG: NUDIX domain-containing protein [Actinomycetota bacterium]|nr:NUDIX domain-containing protein [Actinomycetota bacterium]
MTRGARIVAYVVRESPETGIDELLLVEGDEIGRRPVRVVRELGSDAGTRYVHAVLIDQVPEWEGRWARLTLDYDGPFAHALVRDRVVAYVTRNRDRREELLTIEAEGYPEDGVQVPAGRLDHGETLTEGVLRELAEETGLTDVRIVRPLPDFECAYPSYNHNHAFHLVSDGATRDTWRHAVHGDGVDAGIVHICRWVPLAPDLELWNSRDPMLAKLEL